MLGYCKKCRLYKFLSVNKKCDSCNSSFAQFNRNYEETIPQSDPNIEFRQSSSITKDIDPAGNDW